MDAMDELVRLPTDALDQMLCSPELSAVLDVDTRVDGATDWRIRYAEAMETISVAAHAAGAVFPSRDHAAGELFARASGGGFGIRESLPSKVLSLLEPVSPLAIHSRYQPTSREQEMESAVAACVFAATNPDLVERQRIDILDGSLWLVTVHSPRSKYKTRFRSEGAKDVDDPKLLAHEHVFQRKQMRGRVLANPSPTAIRAILAEAVGCTVLRTEHQALNAVSKLDGWSRYKAAGIRVYDCGPDGDQDPRAVDWSELGV